MRSLSILLVWLISMPVLPQLSAQDAPKLSIVVLDGEGAVNNIKQRTARETIVQVEDENHKPVAGAAVVFAVQSQGAGGSFAGSQTVTVMSDAQGRAVARGFRPNNVQGQYQIRVTASKDGQTANTTISQSNVVAAGAAAAGAKAGGISGKLIAVIVVAAAAAAGGAVYATHNGGSSNSATIPAGTSVTAGTGTIGPPR